MFLVGDHVGFTNHVILPAWLNGGEWVLGNLEGPWIGERAKWSCPEPPRKAGPRVWNGFVAEGPRWIFCLANNHMMDFGVEGLKETLVRCGARGIPVVGAGDETKRACAPIIVEEAGRCIGILACAEHQFGMADDGVPGIAPLGAWMFDAIRELRKHVDAVIVSVHAAVEMSPIPTPEARAWYRALIDSGADVVHGHHAHVPQGWETYKHGRIYYGLGNFLVDPARWGKSANTLWSLTVHLSFASDGSLLSEVVPVRIVEEGGGVRIDKIERSEVADAYLAALQDVLDDEARYRGAWQTVAIDLYHSLYEHNLGFYPVDGHRPSLRDWLKRLYHTMRTLWAFFRGTEKSNYPLVQYNYVQCESHRDLLAEAMGVRLGVRRSFMTGKAKDLACLLLRAMPIH